MTSGPLLEQARRYTVYTALCFILFSLTLFARHQHVGWETDGIVIRVGQLQDLAAEMPIGRQTLVGSLGLMPLPSLTALPFLPFLDPSRYALAVLFGLALLLSVAGWPLRDLLRSAGFGRFAEAAPAFLAAAAWFLGGTPWADFLACLPMLILALCLGARPSPEQRALAGVFWALALFSHFAGLVAVLVRAAWHGAAMLFRPDAEIRAVRWIQWTTILYGFGVYLFLNWMILGSALYPFRTAERWRLPGGDTRSAKTELRTMLARRFPDCQPVASGPWGYAIRPLLEAAEGHHVMDLHPRKLPAGETGTLVLVIPSGNNPFSPLNDADPARLNEGDYATLPLVETIGTWTFVRLDLPSPPP